MDIELIERPSLASGQLYNNKDYFLQINFSDTNFVIPMCCDACALKAKFKFEEELLAMKNAKKPRKKGMR